MKRISRFYYLPLLLLLFFSGIFFEACGQKTDNKTVEKIKKEQEDVMPCEIFTLSDLKAYFNLADDLDLELKDKNMPYPTCSTEWTLGTKEKKKLSNGMEYETDVWNKYMLVVVSGVDASAFEAATGHYKDREMLSLGDQSAWSARSNQITVLSGSTLFHLNVRAPDFNKDPKSMLIELANTIIDRL